MAEPKFEVFANRDINEELTIIDNILDKCEELGSDATLESLDQQLIQALREAGY